MAMPESPSSSEVRVGLFAETEDTSIARIYRRIRPSWTHLTVVCVTVPRLPGFAHGAFQTCARSAFSGGITHDG